MLGHQLPTAMDLDAFAAALARMPEGEARELVDGRVEISDAGRACAHNVLVQNIARGAMRRLRVMDAPHRTFVNTFSLASRQLRSALPPHVMVRSGRLPPGATSCDDPAAIVEVREWGEAGGREDRWAVCRRLPSLRHYAVVESAVPLVRVHDGVGDGWREARVAEGFDAALELPALDLSIPLAEVYRDVLMP